MSTNKHLYTVPITSDLENVCHNLIYHQCSIPKKEKLNDITIQDSISKTSATNNTKKQSKKTTNCDSNEDIIYLT